MRSRSRWFTFAVALSALSLAATLAGCGSDGGGSKGTCRTAGGCGDDFTRGQCDLLNGTFGKGKSCAVHNDEEPAAEEE